MPSTAEALTEPQRELFEKRNFAHVATICPDGHPHVSPIWVDVDDDHIIFNTAEGRVKERNLRRDPRIAVSIFDQENPYRMVAIQGRVVEMTREGAEGHIDKLSRKYIGKPYPYHGDRVLVRIVPERVASMGF